MTMAPERRTVNTRLLTPVRLTPDPDSVEQVLDLLDGSAAWLTALGIDQWPCSFRRPSLDDIQKDRVDAIYRHAEVGELWALQEGSTMVATAIVTHWPDVDFAHGWKCTQAELFNARYLCRLAVDRSVAGQGIGALMVDYASWVARCAGVQWLRLDCAKHNERLHAYYRRIGFEHVNTVDLDHRKSGALFQRMV